jgi:PrtD family type I secretion system ABC transporter
MRSSRRLLKQARRAVLVAVLFSACINILMLAMPLYTLQLFDTVVPTGSVETLVLLTLMVGAAILTLGIIELCRDRILMRAGLWLDHTLGQHVLENGLKGGASPADLRLDALALRQLRSLLTSPVASSLLDIPWTPAFLLVLTLLHPWLGMVGIIAALCMIVLAWVQGKTTARAQAESTQATEAADRWWSNVSTHSGLTGALGLTYGASENWERSNRSQVRSNYTISKRTSIAKALARSVRIGAQTMLYAIGALLIIRNELAPGALIASAILLTRGIGPLESLVTSLRAAAAARQGYGRLKALVPDVQTPRVGAEDHASLGRVILHDVTVYHPTRKAPSLRGISLSLEPGECLGIVGPNGAGKSTLAALMAGALVPASGAADLNGVSIHRWQRNDGDPPIGYMPDEPALIEGTVHQNIARFREASLMAVAKSAMRAGVHETIATLQAGYDTAVGAGGAGLALRERRAVALARAVHGNPRLVVLDEPEIGLDGPSLRRLVRMMEALKADGIGVVVATQDPRLLGLTDQIVVLNAGTVQAIGPARDVAERFGMSRKLAAVSSEARVH